MSSKQAAECLGVNSNRQGVLHARRLPDTPGVELRYRGPRDLLTSDANEHASNRIEEQTLLFFDITISRR